VFALSAILLAAGYLLLGVLAAILYLRHAGTRPVAAADAPEVESFDEELVAVLAAAAAEILQAPVRVHRVHVRRERGAEVWSRAGRMDIMVSHRVEPKR
jgi:hypothetical protein